MKKHVKEQQIVLPAEVIKQAAKQLGMIDGDDDARVLAALDDYFKTLNDGQYSPMSGEHNNASNTTEVYHIAKKHGIDPARMMKYLTDVAVFDKFQKLSVSEAYSILTKSNQEKPMSKEVQKGFRQVLEDFESKILGENPYYYNTGMVEADSEGLQKRLQQFLLDVGVPFNFPGEKAELWLDSQDIETVVKQFPEAEQYIVPTEVEYDAAEGSFWMNGTHVGDGDGSHFEPAEDMFISTMPGTPDPGVSMDEPVQEGPEGFQVGDAVRVLPHMSVNPNGDEAKIVKVHVPGQHYVVSTPDGYEQPVSQMDIQPLDQPTFTDKLGMGEARPKKVKRSSQVSKDAPKPAPTQRNTVAKHGQVNRASAHKSKKDYQRKPKHSGRYEGVKK